MSFVGKVHEIEKHATRGKRERTETMGLHGLSHQDMADVSFSEMCIVTVSMCDPAFNVVRNDALLFGMKLGDA